MFYYKQFFQKKEKEKDMISSALFIIGCLFGILSVLLLVVSDDPDNKYIHYEDSLFLIAIFIAAAVGNYLGF